MTIKLQLFPSVADEGIFRYDGYDFQVGCVLPPNQVDILVEENAYHIQNEVCRKECPRFFSEHTARIKLQERALAAKGAQLNDVALQRLMDAFYKKNPNKCRGRLQDIDKCPEGYTTEHRVTLFTPELVFLFECPEDELGWDPEDYDEARWKLLFKRDYYHYPYQIGNVYENASICWGDVDFPADHREAVREFFTSKFNWDLTADYFRVVDEPHGSDKYETEEYYDDELDDYIVEYYRVFVPNLIKDYHAWFERYYKYAEYEYEYRFDRSFDRCVKRKEGVMGILWGSTERAELWNASTSSSKEYFYGWVIAKDGDNCLIEVPKDGQEPIPLTYNTRTNRLTKLRRKAPALA